jgi:phosphoribosylformimino-5-aminoimidazole carboxamide ribotide isomerase
VELIPALDLIGGDVVRLTQGDYAEITTYGDPMALALRLFDGGAPRIHLVDLDAAKSGDPVNRSVIRAIADALPIPVQTGGGIRTAADVEWLLGAGVDRVILGTVAIEEPELACALATAAPQQVLLGLDYRVDGDGRLLPAGRGWLTLGDQTVDELLERYADAPFGGVVATAIARDGMLNGPDLESLAHLVATSPFGVIASGGVSSLDDLRALAGLHSEGKGLLGAIAGKAVLEGRFSVDEGVAACRASA